MSYRDDQNMVIELSDVTFEEGADIFPDEYKTTVGLLRLPFRIPKFTIEKRDFLDRVLHISEHKDIDYTVYTDFPKDYIVKVEEVNSMDALMSETIKRLIERSDLHHLESHGEAILIFNRNLALARVKDYIRMIQFVEGFKTLLMHGRQMTLKSQDKL